MNFTQVTKPETLSSIETTSSPKALEFIFESGYKLLVSDIDFTLTKNRNDNIYPQGGYITFNQAGAKSIGIYGQAFNIDNPINISGNTLTDYDSVKNALSVIL